MWEKIVGIIVVGFGGFMLGYAASDMVDSAAYTTACEEKGGAVVLVDGKRECRQLGKNILLER
jgi:hypothetical protein